MQSNGTEHRLSGPDLREEREQADLTQEQLAVAMGIHRTTLTRAEGKVRVKPGFARRYREAIAQLTSAA